MRAVVCDRLGDPSVLKIEERPLPEPGPRDIVVKVGAASVNFPDVLTVSGDYQHKPDLPFVPGMEGAGTVHAVGAERLDVELGGELVCLNEPGALALLLVDRRSAVDIAQFDPGLGRELLDRLGEGEVVDLLDEAEDVAALAAAEAVPHAPAGRHVEARAALVMERAQSLERPAARRLQGDVLAHHLVDAGPLAHGRDVVVADPAGHARECTCA